MITTLLLTVAFTTGSVTSPVISSTSSPPTTFDFALVSAIEDNEPTQKPKRSPLDGPHFVLRASPLTAHLSQNAQGFRATETDTLDEGRIESDYSSMPTLGVGLGVATEAAYCDLTIAGGALSNSSSDAVVVAGHVRVVAAARMKLGRKFTLGPRVGIAYFTEPQWLGDGDADFDDSFGVLIGAGFTFGMEVVSLAVDVDYIHAEFDVNRRNGVVTNRRRLDLSGVSVQVGALCRF